MLESLSIRRLAAAVACLAAGPVATAGAHTSQGGGTGYGAGRPVVSTLECVSGERSRCARGQLLRVRGEGLAQADSVVFLGRSGRADDRDVRPQKRSPHRVVVRVPADARSGPVRVTGRAAGRSKPSGHLRVVAAAPPDVTVAVPPGEGVFPVRGRFDFGTAVNAFGGGRGHGGQDILARCSTPIVAARSGEVSAATFQSRAGNYVAITADDGTSQVYMHMRDAVGVAPGERVVAGQPIGRVGRTGRASACHLHYESWTAPGYHRGGMAIDPLPELQQFAARG